MTLEAAVEQVDTEETFEQTLEAMEETLEAEEAKSGETEAEAGEETGDQQTQEAESEVSIGFDDDPTPEGDQGTETPVIRTLRGENKQLVRRVRELETQLKTTKAPAVEEEVGAEPTLADCEFDEDAFKKKWVDWSGRKAAADRRASERQEQERQATEAYQKKLDAYKSAAAGLGVKDFEEAEGEARAVFSPVQQSILVKHMAQPAALVYALGRTPAKAKELAAITDPIEFALKAKQLEDKHLKVTTAQRKAPPPEQKVSGSGKTQAVTSSHLNTLHKKAQESGDYTAYLAAKRKASERTG